MKLIISALLISSAAAFAPAQTGKASTSLKAVDATKAIGVQTPLGFYDPFRIFGDDPTAVDDDKFARARYTELKHGRVAMLAVVGYLVTYAGVRFPGAENIPCGFAALNEIPGMVWAQMLATQFVMEMANGRLTLDGKDFTGTQEFPGDFRNGFIDFGWNSQSDAWKEKKRAVELNNGRAAMMGILGLMVHEQIGNIGAVLPYGQ
uniref:Plastid light harvesting protein n=1 Tax=Ditylum brightwellii TaxID=49249 RepID=A0A6S9CTM2_9STRA|mmetsp:Transcript_13830/g.18511  ORF Transcript_13830/g.18511 Transcript_13830/m.18511 type:complete len:205 (+) Transcript_13830:24-638(+)|eukprot:4754673-Ditylum_brightwellii.AAC.1